MLDWVIFMIGPALINPSVSTGRIKCETAERNACMSPASRVSIVMKPVTGAGAMTSMSSRPSGAGAQ